MLMRGDLQKLFDQINPVFENAFKKIEALEKRVEELEKAKKAPGRPKKEEEEV
jgi:BMFP domain-containing protein YqiC